MLGLSQSGVANKLRLLRHSPPVQQRLRETELSERHARALLKLNTEPQKLKAIETIARLDMNVARTEQYIESLLTPELQKSTKIDISGFIKRVSATLTKFQAAGVSAISQRTETEKEIVLTITIPK